MVDLNYIVDASEALDFLICSIFFSCYITCIWEYLAGRKVFMRSYREKASTIGVVVTIIVMPKFVILDDIVDVVFKL